VRPLADVANVTLVQSTHEKKRSIEESFAADNFDKLQDISGEHQDQHKKEIDAATYMQMLDLAGIRLKQLDESIGQNERIVD